MDISSLSNSSFSRTVKPSRSSSDRQFNEQTHAVLVDNKLQERREHERAIQEKLQHRREQNQRRLDGRIISFGRQQQDDVSIQQKQASYNRSRVNDAYGTSSTATNSSNRFHEQRSQQQNIDAIDIVV